MRIIYAGLIVVLWGQPLFAWWSMGGSTHKAVSEGALNHIKYNRAGQYPDIERFEGIISQATYTLGNDALAHGYEENVSSRADAGKYNGGDYGTWWRDFVQVKYKQAQFGGDKNAYFYVGSMAHLVQDQLVPAHAANVYHAGAVFDDLEAYVGFWALGPTANGDNYWDNNPVYYYYNSENTDVSPIILTQNRIRTLKYPSDGPVTQWRDRLYWLSNPYPQYAYTGQSFFGDLSKGEQFQGGWGVYGGPNGTDMYARWMSVNPYTTDSPSVATEQLNESVSYTAGMLMAVSRSLPPIVTSFGISSSNIEPGKTVQITFDILENRTPGANVYLTLGGADGPAIISGEYKTGKYVALEVEYAADKLPWKKHLDIAWDGKLANGEYPPSGSKKLCVMVRDLDENPSEVSCVDFTIDTGGPRVSLGSALGTIYVDYQGVGTVSPAQSNPYMLETMGLALGVHDDSSGVKKIELRKIEQPDTEGVIVYSKEFDIPVGLFEEQPLPALADGQYKLIAEDKDGNRTVAPFQLGSISVPEDKAASVSAYNSSTGLLSVRLEVDAISSYDLTKLDLLDDVSGQLIESRSLSGKLDRQVFQLNDILALGNFGEYSDVTAKRRLRLTDVSGQVLERGEWLQVQENSIAISGTSHEKASQTQDLLSLGLLPGALTAKKWPLWYSLGWKSDMSGGLVSYQPAGRVEILRYI